jgi:hypothetical protein
MMGSALLQLVIKMLSRPNPTGRSWDSLEREDFLFWHDWIVSGAVAVFIYWVKALSSDANASALGPGLEVSTGPVITQGQYALSVGVLLISFVFVPMIMNAVLHDKEGERRLDNKYIIVANLLGMAMLLADVLGGAQLGK